MRYRIVALLKTELETYRNGTFDLEGSPPASSPVYEQILCGYTNSWGLALQSAAKIVLGGAVQSNEEAGYAVFIPIHRLHEVRIEPDTLEES